MTQPLSAVVLFLVACLSAPAVEVPPAKADAQLAVQVDWPTFLADQDPVWLRLPTHFYEGPFVGNGLVGTIVFADDQAKNTLRFELGRTDVYDHRPEGPAAHHRCRLPIGQLLLTPVGRITATRLRTDLWHAEITGTLTTEAGTLDLRCFAPSGGEVLVLELKATGGETAARASLRPEQGNSPRFTIGRDKNLKYDPNPPFTVEHRDGVEVAVQPLLAGSDYATAWSDTSAAGGRRTILVALANRRGAGRSPETGSAADAVAALRRAQAQGVPALETAHRTWWHAYYPASFLTVPEAKIASFYWQQLYKMASATRPDRPVVDLMGPWFKRTVWAAYWQNLNTQLSYYTTNVTNHPDFNEPQSRLLERCTADLIANVPMEWQGDSAALGNPTGFNELRASAPGPVNLKPGQRYSYIALPWLMQQFYLHVRYTADDPRLKTTVFPLLVRTMNVYLHTLVLGADGLYHVPLAFSDEYGNAEDTSMNLAFVRWGLETLIATAQRLSLPAPDLPRWQEVLAKLADLPVDPATGIMIGKDTPFAKSHRHSSHLFAIYPLQVLHPERRPESRALIEQSLRHFTSLVGDECLFKFTATSSLWSTIGNGDEGLRWLNRALEPQAKGPTIGANTLYSENGWPTYESPISAARSLTDLLIQSRNGVIRVFPALPTTWHDASFHQFRGEGAFLVSARRKAGKTEFIAVTSLAGEPCRLACDLPAPIRILGRPGTLTPDAQGILSLTLATGETGILVSGSGNPDLTIAPLAVAKGATWGLP